MYTSQLTLAEDAGLSACASGLSKGFTCVLASIVIIDELLTRDTTFSLTSLNVHRVLAAGCLLAVKLVEDDCPTNKLFGQIAGLPTDEMNSCEIQLLRKLDWHVGGLITCEKFAELCQTVLLYE